MSIIKLEELRNLTGMRALIRADLNVPMKNGRITEETGIYATVPTIQFLIKTGPKVVVVPNLGLPEAGEYAERHSVWASSEKR